MTLIRDAKHDIQLVKDINTYTVLELIQRGGPLGRSEIAQRTNVSLATVCSIVNALMEQGYVLESDSGEYTGGRRSPNYAFNPRAGYLIGVDVGGTKMLAGLTDLSGEILARAELPTPQSSDNQAEEVFAELLRLISQLQEQIPVGSEGLRGLGLGVPGVVDRVSGDVTLAPALGWTHFPLSERLRQHYTCPIFCENDVNTILLGEQWRGAAQDAQNAVCVAVGTGIGASIMINGSIYYGSNNAAGEVGYMVTTLEAMRHSYPRFGYLESLGSGTGIAERAKQRIATSNEFSLISVLAVGGEIEASHVMQAAESNDPIALIVVDETVQLLSAALINAACLLNPEIILLAGGVMKSGALFVSKIQDAVNRVVPYPPQIALLKLGLDAGILGAVAGVIKSSELSVKYSQLL